MASSVSSTSLSSTLRGYGGLASGLDRDELIEQMSSASRLKIAKQQQKKDKLEWQQTAIRNITSKIYDFTSKFTSYSKPSTNLMSSQLYTRNRITATGANSACVSVSGTASATQNISIAGIKQLASNASMSTEALSDQTLETGTIELGKGGKLSSETDISKIAGNSLYITYGKKVYTVSMGDMDDLSDSEIKDPSKIAEQINSQLGKVEVGNGKTLADTMGVSVQNDHFVFRAKSGSAGNLLKISGGTGKVLEGLGIIRPGENFNDLNDDSVTISDRNSLISKYTGSLTERKSAAQLLSGKQMSFTYNGTTKWVTLDKFTVGDTIETVQKDLQAKLDKEFGRGRIEVGLTTDPETYDGNTAISASLSFTTTTPDGAKDLTSTLSINSAENLVGARGLFGLKEGASNRTNVSTALGNSGLTALEGIDLTEKFGYREAGSSKDELFLSINGKRIEGITADSSINDIINKINRADAGVEVVYQSISDKFVVTSTENGASGKIKFDDYTDADGKSVSGKQNLARYLFGGNDNVVKTNEIALRPGGTLAEKTVYSNLAGGNLELTYNNTKYTVSMGDMKDVAETYLDNMGEIAKAINKRLAGVKTDDGKALSELFEVKVGSGTDSTKFVFEAKTDSEIQISGGSAEVLEGLGIVTAGNPLPEIKVTKDSPYKAGNSSKLTHSITTAQLLSGKQITFDYNGTKKQITLGTYKDGSDGSDPDTINKVIDDIQIWLDSEDGFGKTGEKSNVKVSRIPNTPLDDFTWSASLTFETLNESDKLVIGDKENDSTELLGDGGLFDILPQAAFNRGKDAVVSIRYPGSNDEVEITRGSNTFSMDGLNITLKNTFGYNDDGTLKPANEVEAVTISAEVDADKTADVVQQMIDAYNDIVDLVNTECKTKPDRDYQPLTDEQKEEMTESQIEKWEEKAKQGILFADSDLRMMANALRNVINSGDSKALSDIGITTSSSYSDNGKLVLDVDKFKAKLQEDPDGVKELLTRAVETKTDEKGNTITTRAGGLMTNIKSVLDKYGITTGSTKGILIERAGSIYSPTSVLSNSIQKQLDDLDEVIDKLNDRMQSEMDRYISQFTSLETLISQMNSQSSYLSSMFA